MLEKIGQPSTIGQKREWDREARVAQLYLDNPTPEFRQALNIACETSNNIFKLSRNLEGRTLAVVSSDFYAVELLKRCPWALELAGTGTFEPKSFIQQAQTWAWKAMSAASFPLEGEYTGLVWAEPEKSDAGQVLKSLRQHAAPDATLAVIASTRLRGFLPAWKQAKGRMTDLRPANNPLDAGQVLRLLSRSGWQVERCMGFHGPRSMIWTLVMRLAETSDRPDWTDRARFALRNTYIENGWLWKFSPLALICANPV